MQAKSAMRKSTTGSYQWKRAKLLLVRDFQEHESTPKTIKNYLTICKCSAGDEVDYGIFRHQKPLNVLPVLYKSKNEGAVYERL